MEMALNAARSTIAGLEGENAELRTQLQQAYVRINALEIETKASMAVIDLILGEDGHE